MRPKLDGPSGSSTSRRLDGSRMPIARTNSRSTSVSVTMPTSVPPSVTGSAPIRFSTSSRAASSTDTMGSTVMTRFVMMSPAVTPPEPEPVAVAAGFATRAGQDGLEVAVRDDPDQLFVVQHREVAHAPALEQEHNLFERGLGPDARDVVLHDVLDQH